MGGMTFFFAVSLSFYILITLAAYKAYKTKKIIPFLIGLVIAVLIGLSLKYSLQVPRPSYEYLGINKWDKYAFPSMHALLSFYAGAYIGIAGLAWAILIALSRVFLHVHTTADITAGGILGITLYYFLKNINVYQIKKKEAMRKSIHLIVSIILFLAAYFLSTFEFLLIVVGMLLGYFTAMAFPSTKRIYHYVKRKEKDNSAIILILSITATYLLLGQKSGLAGIIAAIGDGISPLIAMMLDKKNKRSLRAAIITSILVFAGIYYLFKSHIIAGTAAVLFFMIDYFNDKIEDNLLMPITVGAVTRILTLII